MLYVLKRNQYILNWETNHGKPVLPGISNVTCILSTRNITLCIFQWHNNWRIISIKKFLHCPLSCFMYCNQSIWSIVTFTWRYNCCQILSSFFVLKWIICGLTISFLYYHSVLPKPKSWHLIPYQIIRTLKKKNQYFLLPLNSLKKLQKINKAVAWKWSLVIVSVENSMFMVSFK